MSGKNPLSFYGGQFEVDSQLPSVPAGLRSPSLSSEGAPQSTRFGGLLTYEKPIVEFFPDIAIPNSSNSTFIRGRELPNNCVGIRFIDVIPGVVGVYASINGGGFRKILDRDTFSNCEIRSVQVSTDATGSCTLQSVGTGD